MSEGHTTFFRNHPLDGNVPLTRWASWACYAGFTVDQLLSIDEAHAIIFRPQAPPGSACDAVSGDSPGNELISYPDQGNGDDLDLADVPVDPHVDLRASFREISTVFPSYAVQLTLPYLNTLGACLTWQGRS